MGRRALLIFLLLIPAGCVSPPKIKSPARLFTGGEAERMEKAQEKQEAVRKEAVHEAKRMSYLNEQIISSLPESRVQQAAVSVSSNTIELLNIADPEPLTSKAKRELDTIFLSLSSHNDEVYEKAIRLLQKEDRVVDKLSVTNADLLKKNEQLIEKLKADYEKQVRLADEYRDLKFTAYLVAFGFIAFFVVSVAFPIFPQLFAASRAAHRALSFTSSTLSKTTHSIESFKRLVEQRRKANAESLNEDKLLQILFAIQEENLDEANKAQIKDIVKEVSKLKPVVPKLV